MQLPTDEELKQIDAALDGFDDSTVESMRRMRELNGLSVGDIAARFTCEKPKNIYKYQQASFEGTRPIHFAAAFSWVTNTPATGFYLTSSIKEAYRGMDEAAVIGLISIGMMPYEQFDIVLSCIYQYLNQMGKNAVDILRTRLFDEIGEVTSDRESLCSAPDVIDLDKFSESYYLSAANTLREFRKSHGITQKKMAKIMGESLHTYQVIEKQTAQVPILLSFGLRIKLAFRLDNHAGFTSLMTHYSEFHEFRKLQYVRDALLVESLRYVPENQKPYVLEIIKGVANAYYKK